MPCGALSTPCPQPTSTRSTTRSSSPTPATAGARSTVALDGAEVDAATYEVVDKARDELTPKLEYLELMLAGARERGLPAAWIAELEALPARFGLA